MKALRGVFLPKCELEGCENYSEIRCIALHILQT